VGTKKSAKIRRGGDRIGALSREAAQRSLPKRRYRGTGFEHPGSETA
jgi:hypothetical protein